MNTNKVKRNKPITKQLSERYGGEWEHYPFHSTWFCKDNRKLWTCYYFQDGYDMNGNRMEESKSTLLLRKLYVYGLESGTEEFYPNLKQ